MIEPHQIQAIKKQTIDSPDHMNFKRTCTMFLVVSEHSFPWQLFYFLNHTVVLIPSTGFLKTEWSVFSNQVKWSVYSVNPYWCADLNFFSAAKFYVELLLLCRCFYCSFCISFIHVKVSITINFNGQGHSHAQIICFS